jgi:integrase
LKVARTYRYVVQDRDRHGNVRVYLRRPGFEKLRMLADPGTPGFDSEYRAGMAANRPQKTAKRPAIPTGTLLAVCMAYYSSADFKRLNVRTRHVRRLILDKLCEQHGSKPVQLMQPKHVRMIRDARAEKPEAANSIVKALRAVFAMATEDGLMRLNPAKEVAYLRSPTDGFHTWSVDEVKRYESHHAIGTAARLALAVMLYTGQRRSDAVQLGPGHIHDGWLTITQVKNRGRKPVSVAMPVIPALRDVIDATACGKSTFIVTAFGKPFTSNGFGNRFRKWCDEAGLPHCSAHGLRKAAAARLAELGCSAHEIMAVTGHTSLKEVQRYTVEAGRRVMAGSAMGRLSEAHAAAKKSHIPAENIGWDEMGDEPVDDAGERPAMVPRGGIEPPTLRFSVACSTN